MAYNDYTDSRDITPARYTSGLRYLEDYPVVTGIRCELHDIMDCATCAQSCPVCNNSLSDGHRHAEIVKVPVVPLVGPQPQIPVPGPQPMPMPQPVTLRKPRKKKIKKVKQTAYPETKAYKILK